MQELLIPLRSLMMGAFIFPRCSMMISTVRARGVVQPVHEPRKKQVGSTLAQPTARTEQLN